MNLYTGNYVVLGIIFALLLLLLLQSYWSFKKKTAGFPFYNPIRFFLYCYVTGKITKDTPFTNVVLEELVRMGKHHIKEGLVMTYCSRPILFIYGEDTIKVFANEKGALDKAPEYKIVGENLGNGLVTSNGERWKEHRKLINPAFSMGMLKEKVPMFNEHAMALVKDLELLVGKQPVDILDDLKFHYISALSESILGLQMDEENKALLVKLAGYVDCLGHMVVQRLIYPWLRWKLLLKFLPSGRKYLQQKKECDEFIDNIVLGMKKRILSNNNDDKIHFGNHLRKSFAYLLISHHLKDPSSFIIEDLHHEVATIMAAGYDTVTMSTMWCLFLLGMHPDVQEKVFSEIQSVTSDHITYEESCNLVYLEAVIMESLRLYPAVPIFGRNLTKDVQCGKYKVLKGTSIAFFPYLSHRDPKVFPGPEKFEPERFLNADLKKSWNFIPFSEGSRNCIGKNYALIEMKIFLGHVLRNFKITSLDKREDIKLCWAIALSPVKRPRFKITRRHNI